jgi:bifunctional oligoribonuclease and PAP phosphatase NrnA
LKNNLDIWRSLLYIKKLVKIKNMLSIGQQIFEQINKAKNILIVFPKNWNGDSVSGSLALFLFLKKLDKNVEIAAETIKESDDDSKSPGKIFSFLPGFNEIKNSIENLRKFIISLDISSAKVSQIKYKVSDNTLNFIVSPKEGFFTSDDISSSYSGFKYDLIIALDSPDLESLGKIYDNDTEFFYKTPIINIYHHSDNEEYGQINLVELTAVSTTEILFSLFESYSRELIDEDIATCLLTGIISKTKSFKTSNITPKTLLTTSQLISMGGRREEIVNHLYRSRSLNVLKLWGRILARLSGSNDNIFVWSTLSQVDFAKTNSSEDDLYDVVDELIVSIPQAKIIALIYELEPNKTNFIIFSVKNINSKEFIKEYNPTGTEKIALAEINKPLTEAEKEIVENIKEKLSQIAS